MKLSIDRLNVHVIARYMILITYIYKSMSKKKRIYYFQIQFPKITSSKRNCTCIQKRNQLG